jgi:hypothetical protein
MKAIGRTLWALAGGHIPLACSGREPDFTSRDQLSLLNTGQQSASLELTLFHAESDPVGPYRLQVAPRRLRRIRINDLIDPAAPPLGSEYGVLIRADVPIVVQFTRLDSGQREVGLCGTMAYPAG